MEQKYNASVAKVFGLLTNAKWLEERCLALGELSAKCKTKKTPNIVVTMERRVRRELSPIISKVLNPESDLTFEENWEGSAKEGYQGTIVINIEDKPIRISCDFELVPDGKGCIYRVEHRAKVKILFVGAVIEQFVLDQTRKGCQEELDYLKDYLAAEK